MDYSLFFNISINTLCSLVPPVYGPYPLFQTIFPPIAIEITNKYFHLNSPIRLTQLIINFYRGSQQFTSK